jgi:hypothetical protein
VNLRRVELDADDAAAWLAAERWTDGLPVVVPTEDRVAAMVAASGRDPEEQLGAMPPAFALVTVEKIAACAVLAGCPSEAARVVVAAVEAVLAAPFRIASVQATTSPATPLLVVDGPAATEAGLASGTGCFGPGAGTNVAVGRAVRLVMTVVGGGRPDDGDPATLGQPAKTGACIAERTDASPWPSLASRRGIAAGASAVTAFAITGTWQISEPSTAPADVEHQVLHGMISLGHCSQPRLPQSAEQLLLVSPPIAAALAVRHPDVQSLQEALFERVRVPVSWVPPAKRDLTWARLEELGLPVPGPDGTVPLAESPDTFVVLVAGGDAGVQSMGMSTLTLSRSATALVR